MIYWILFYEYFKIGLFSIGGGLATLPFLINLTYKYDWLTKQSLADMVAVSESTPGPMGVNIATYVGFEKGNVLGGFIATLGLITPSIIIIILIAKVLEKFKENAVVQNIFNGLRPASVGLIIVAGFEVVKIALLNMELYAVTKNIMDLINYKSVIIFAILFYTVMKYKKHPVIYIGAAAAVGIILKL